MRRFGDCRETVNLQSIEFTRWTSVRIDRSPLSEGSCCSKVSIAVQPPVCPKIGNASFARSHARPVAPPTVVVNKGAPCASENLHGFLPSDKYAS